MDFQEWYDSLVNLLKSEWISSLSEVVTSIPEGFEIRRKID